METNQSAMTTKKPSTQSGAAAVAAEKAAAVGRGVEATEEQARAIIYMAKRAMAEEAKTKTRADDGAASAAGKPSSSLKRSLECFLQGRKNRATSSSAATRLRCLETSAASSSSSSN